MTDLDRTATALRDVRDLLQSAGTPAGVRSFAASQGIDRIDLAYPYAFGQLSARVHELLAALDAEATA